jgi:hypothetical protein
MTKTFFLVSLFFWLSAASSVEVSSDQTSILWQTPIRHTKISTPAGWHYALVSTAVENANILNLNSTFQNELLPNAEARAASLNSAFFLWQQAWKQNAVAGPAMPSSIPSSMFGATPGYSELVARFETAARKFLVEVLGASPALAAAGRASPREGAPADCWSSAHRMNGGSWHPPHHHFTRTEVVSGVFYASIPRRDDRGRGQKAGALVFSDPRGFVAPFGHAHSVQPVEGMLVLFPSWLVHTVEPSSLATRRADEDPPDDLHETLQANVEAEVDGGATAVPPLATPPKREKAKKKKRRKSKPAASSVPVASSADWRISFSCNFHVPLTSDVSKVAAAGFAM